MDQTTARSTEAGGGILRTARRAMQVRRLRGEAGQTPTEYLMIVGIMAAVILIAFILFFWDKVKPAAETWSEKASDAVGASKGKKSTVDD
jgi:Flp pilus assembly pilin Flp